MDKQQNNIVQYIYTIVVQNYQKLLQKAQYLISSALGK